MGRIFISYSRRDTAVVDRIVPNLCEAGLNVWIDRQDIHAGNTWRVQIVQAIDTCDAFVLMLSPNSAASENVRKEIDLAQDSGRKIFAMMLEPVRIPAEIRYELAGLQFINVPALGFETALCQLIATLKEHIASQSPVSELPVHQAELVIHGVDLQSFGSEQRQQLISFVAGLANTSPSSLAIANAGSSSSHVFVDMPAASAYTLKTLALNRDVRLKNFGVTSLRLAGDTKFINIAFSVLTTAATISFLHGLWLGTPSLFAPVIGVTAGKVLTLSLVAMLVTGLAGSAPKAIAPLLNTPSPSSQPLAAMRPSSTALAPVSGSAPQNSPEPKLDTRQRAQSIFLGTVPIEATSTITPSLAATQGPVSVLQSLVCRTGPTDKYPVVSSIRANTVVQLIAPACIEGWWIINDPTYDTPCWIEEANLEFSPAVDWNTQVCVPVPPVSQPTSRPTPKPTKRTTSCPSAC